MSMQTRRLGKLGDEVSVVGFGAWPIGGGMGRIDEKQAIETVHAAVDNGITLIDTAQGYKSSEEIIGKSLSGGLRDDVFLATKASFDFSRAGIRAAIENSLRMLQTDHVDLYQIHSWSSRYPIEESMEEMVRLKEEGKTRFIGISNFSVEQTAAAAAVGTVESTQPAYNLFDREIEEALLPHCKREGIGILAHSIFAKGLLTGKYSPESRFADDDERSSMARFNGQLFRDYLGRTERLRGIAAELGISLVQLSVAWVLRNPAVTCALAGAKSPAQVAEQAHGAEVRLSDELLQRIEGILAA